MIKYDRNLVIMIMSDILIIFREKIKGLTKSFNYDDMELDLITLAYYSLYMLDSAITSLLDKVLSSVHIIFTKNLIASLMAVCPEISEDEIELHRNSLGLSLIEEYDFRTSSWNDAPYIIIDKTGADLKSILATIIHELKHKINILVPRVNSARKLYYYGLSIRHSDGTIENNMLDEVLMNIIPAYVLVLLTL